jgi:radical SAM protein with 4Fe4S-binding SPASM domain
MEELDLHVTNRCNLRCIHCCFDSGRSAMPELGTAKICEVIGEAVVLGAREIHVTGGEPFLRPDVLEIVAEAIALGARVRVQSNGTLLDRRRLSRLAALGVDELMISIDGPEEINDGIRGPGSHAKAWSAVQEALALGIPVRVNTVVMQRNLRAIAPLLLRTLDLGVSVHSFFHFTPFGAGAGCLEETIGKREWLVFIEDLRALCAAQDTARTGVTDVVVEQVFLEWKDAPGNQLGCRIFQKKYGQLLCDGNVSPCTFLLGTDLFLGNVRNATLESIWNDERAWKKYEAGSGFCRDCGRFDLCQGGCWLYAYRLGGALERDPRCDPADGAIPLCPYLKRNVRLTTVVHSTADAIRRRSP